MKGHAGRCIIATLAAMLSMLALSASALGAESHEEERHRGRALGIKAYMYGQPLLDLQRIYDTTTSVTVPTHDGYAPVNRFSHFTELVTSSENVVVAPNLDTLYSIAFLKLEPHPIVLHVPSAERFLVVEMVDPYTEDFANIGTQASGVYAPGDYLIVPPGTDEGVQEVEGLKVIHSPYEQVWLIGRVEVLGPSDTEEARRINEQFELVPFNKWHKEGLAYEPPAPRREVTEPTVAHIPGTGKNKKGKAENPLLYWKALGRALQEYPPPAADEPLLEELATVGIGPGRFPTASNVGAGVLEGVSEAVESGPLEVLLAVKAAYEASAPLHHGWLVDGLGSYGTNYTLRALTDRLGVGALTPNVSIYPLALVDDTGARLNGSAGKRYVAVFPASDFPVPVQAFWSMTMYESDGFLVANPLERYTLGSRSPLHYNPDGSLYMYVQSAEPSSEAQKEDWLPAPSGEFHLIMRLYGTYPQDIEPLLEGAAGSWQPPKLEPCEASGFTAAGIECAA